MRITNENTALLLLLYLTIENIFNCFCALPFLQTSHQELKNQLKRKDL